MSTRSLAEHPQITYVTSLCHISHYPIQKTVSAILLKISGLLWTRETVATIKIITKSNCMRFNFMLVCTFFKKDFWISAFGQDGVIESGFILLPKTANERTWYMFWRHWILGNGRHPWELRFYKKLSELGIEFINLTSSTWEKASTKPHSYHHI